MDVAVRCGTIDGANYESEAMNDDPRSTVEPWQPDELQRYSESRARKKKADPFGAGFFPHWGPCLATPCQTEPCLSRPSPA